ncbi:cupin domain-containing protein [Shewanella woodyi]|uniref:Cupin 2 conserved barrel domain protein n=1 Tax=Shewanella woodyi (strain ATCC 51908 / MS32) TaxID=392500 RepID=B1KFS5_SHEWM|nr:cupin domain-containing protein [Shewanella woodyi]ACA85241.1 Cupin 2 conserved barrel domain protein [Shewanella woodyi ATCC 51908]
MNKQNLFASLPADLTHEVFEQVGGSDTVLIERIVSKAHVTPKGQWYDQDRNEWVMVLKGEAKLQFEDVEPIHLKVGDYIDIPAHCKHRVSWTSEETETLWLAIHY